MSSFMDILEYDLADAVAAPVCASGRGLGDCWSSSEWTWDAKQFLQTASSSTAMCKLLAPGGAWSLPTFVTDVRN
jgi:hypothetical protein